MKLLITGSIAYDYLMTFPGHFKDHILAEHLDRLSLSFLVDSMIRRRGGIAANIAYTLGLLGERTMVMATVGEDFDDYRAWLEENNVDTSAIKTIPGMFTASFFVTTDQDNAQIASFYTGAMAHAKELHIADIANRPELVMISPNDPEAMVQYARECQQLSIPYLYDPSQQIVRLSPSSLREGIKGCLALFANDYELGLIVEKTGMDLETIIRYATFIIITRGEYGADIYTKHDLITIPAVPPCGVADPTGVGDAFRGGFLKGYLHNLSLERCGQIGTLVATYCLENYGTQGHRFNLAEFIERFKEHFGDHEELDLLL
jgi:adenosine kinase